MTEWPSVLKINRDSLNETAPDNTIRSSMAVGPDKIRKRGSSAVRKLSFYMTLTDTNVNVIDNFYIENCALAFDFKHPRTKQYCRARFTSPPQYSLNETLWNVTVELEILP